MLEIIIGSFILIVLAGTALGFGQLFGRPPITGRCSPDNPECCMHANGNRRCSRPEGG